jgi:serine/threonine-protein kinase
MKLIKVSLYFIVPIIMFILSAYLTIDILLKKQENTICPDVRGKNVEEAKRLIESKGLTLSVLRYERRNDVPYNHITVQKPEANIPIRKGRTVNVLVSEGPELVGVPMLAGQPFQHAEEILNERHIGIEKTIYVPHAKTGMVIAQIPKGGESMLEGKKMVLFIGSEQKTYYLMPDINNANVLQLIEEMDTKKIKYKTTIEKSGHITPGSKIRTSISPKTIFNGEDEISININLGG